MNPTTYLTTGLKTTYMAKILDFFESFLLMGNYNSYYCTRANKYSKILVLALRLSNEKRMKNVF